MYSMLVAEMVKYTLLRSVLIAHLSKVIGCISLVHYLVTGPVNNINVLKRPAYLNPRMLSNVQASSRRHGLSLPPPLSKYINTMDEKVISAVVNLQATCNNPLDASSISSQVINCQIKELQQQGSAAAAEMEVEKLKLDCTQSMQMLQRWKKTYDNLHEFCVDELLEGCNVKSAN
ncbi:hypothetical protein D5086_025526 [Populus alba]|uniref:Uncharacterized protein n=1 Tax=Populus alba TaxID=43335 RepID=A0ACC4AZR8_POPAL